MFMPSQYIGYFQDATQGYLVTAGKATLILPGDPLRVFAAIGFTNGNLLAVGFDPNIGSNPGPWILSGHQTLELDWSKHGLLVTLPTYVWIDPAWPIGNQTVVVLSLTFNPDH